MGEDRQATEGWHDSADFKWRIHADRPSFPRAPPASGPHPSVDQKSVAILVESAAARRPIVAALNAGQLTAVGPEGISEAAVVIAELSGDAHAALAGIRRRARPDAAILLVLTTAAADTVAAAHSAGAFACLRVPLVAEEVLSLVTSALDSLSARVQVAQLARKLNLQDHLASIGRMSAGLSHELGGPLGAAALNMEVLCAQFTQMTQLLDSVASASPQDLQTRIAEVRAHLRHSATSSGGFAAALSDTVEAHERMKAVLHMMRGLVRRVRDVRSERVDLGRAIEDAKHALAGDLEGVDVEVIADPVVALADETLVGQILANLVSNAVHAAKVLPSPRVRLHSYCSGEFVVASVRDNGPGIPTELKEKIFEPFFTTRRTEGGTGLGLAMCREYALQMGAELSVWSVPGRGSCFRVFLPRFP
jgi:two-component system NtrC family sensor kinase